MPCEWESSTGLGPNAEPSSLHTAAGSLSVTRFDEEIQHLPEEKLGWLQLALLAAQQLVHQCLRQPVSRGSHDVAQLLIIAVGPIIRILYVHAVQSWNLIDHVHCDRDS